MRRTLLLLAIFAPLSLRTTLAGDAPPARPPDSLRFRVPAWSLVRVGRAAIDALVPGWKGHNVALHTSGWPAWNLGSAEVKPFAVGVSKTRDDVACEIRGGEFITGPGLQPPSLPFDDDRVAVERFQWSSNSEFGSVAAANPKVYDPAPRDGYEIPHWFLAHVPRGKSVSLPIALPGPGPVMDARVTIKVEVFGTHEGPVALAGRWANIDLGEQTVPSAAGGATLTFTCPARDVPPPNGPLVFTDRSPDLPAPAPDDVSEGRGTIWIDAVTLEAPMLPHKGPRIEVEKGVRIRLAEVDASPLLKPHWDPPDPIETAKGAEEVILATAPLLAGAKRLAEHRTRNGVRAVVVPIADVWDRMQGGEPDPDAIFQCLAWLSRDGKGPRFVLLCGDAALDRTDIVDWESIPTMYARTMYNGATASDRMFVLPSGDAKTGGPAIGRLPFRDPKDLDAYVDRVVRYETTPPADPTRRMLRFITSEGRFGEQADAMIERLFTQIVATKIPPAYDVEVTFASTNSVYCWPPPQFNEKVIDGLNAGALFYTYVGHGWERGFDHMHVGDERYPILSSTDAPKVDVKGTPPALFVVACTTAIFDLPKSDGIGETLLKRPNGPLAYWGATRDCHPFWNSMVGRELARRLFEDPTRRLGEVIAAATDAAVVGDPKDTERAIIENMMKPLAPPGTDLQRLYVEGSRMYALLGDPAIRIAYPKDDLKVEVASTDTGFSVKVTGPMPDGASVDVSIEVGRDARLPLPKLEKTAADPSGYESMKARYARANDKAVVRGTAKAAGGAATLTIAVPEKQRSRALVAKAWSIFAGDVHQGSSPTPQR